MNDEREPEVESEPGSPTDAEADARCRRGAGGPDDADDDRDPWAAPPHEDDEPVIHRNPPRDWAAPPPWATGAGAAAAATASGAGGARPNEAPDFLASRDPAPRPRGECGGPPGRRIAAVPPPTRGRRRRHPRRASDDLAGLVGAAGAGAAAARRPRPAREPSRRRRSPDRRAARIPTTTASGRRPTVSSTRSRTQQHDGPSWESAKRYEAYPTIKTRAGLPGVPRIAVWAGALGVAALALFFLPALLGVGGGGDGREPEPQRGPRRSPRRPRIRRRSPSRRRRPTSIKKSDTLLKIAKKFDLTLDELLAANKETIKNPDKIKVGQEIIIPVPTPDEVTDPSAAAPGRQRRAPRPLGAPAPARTRRDYRGAMLIAVILPASTRNVASMCWVGAPGRTTSRSAS